MKFVSLFNLRLKHSFYTDQRCRDFRIEPSAETSRLLRNHRLLFRELPDGFRVAVASDDGRAPLIPLPTNEIFVFYLRVQNPDFILYTDLSDIAGKAAPVFTNIGLKPSNVRTLKSADRTASNTETWVVRERIAQAQFTLAGQPLEGLNATGFDIVQPAGSAKVKITGYNSARKTITVDTRTVPESQDLSVRYSVKPRLSRGVFAEVELQYNSSMPALDHDDDPFQIQFTAKAARWKYYLLTDQKGSNGRFTIEDKVATGSPIGFSVQNRTFLNEAPDELDELATALARQYPELQRFRFVSNEPVRCSDAPRQNLELRSGSNTIFGVMPNPSIGNYSKIKQMIDGKPQEQDSLHHVIKYLTTS
jgi:hypothetical protein